MSIHKKVLSNGLMVLVKQNHTIPKVSMQLWFNVGSKDEQTGEKGIAHLIEHSVFNGTKDMLSESDINVAVRKLSGDCNAFTSYDYTGYKFNMPSHHWREMFPIMADCMSNVAFKDEQLNSEMKAVIQELKMLKDNLQRQLVYDLLTTVFSDHPYHYPLIGYKDDLWSVSGKDLAHFYKKHYHPNNAALVVVGDVDPEEVFALAEECFGTIPACDDYTKDTFYHNEDIAAKSVILYRDIRQPIAALAFVIPGIKAKLAHITDVCSIILGAGKSSLLYKKLVDEQKLATSVSVSAIDLFDYGLFYIMYTPKSQVDIPAIEQCVTEVINDIVRNGLLISDVQTALTKAKMYEYDLLESNEMQAYLIGQYYTALGDPEYVFHYLNVDKHVLKKEIESFCKRYFRPSVMHKGLVLPLIDAHDKQWLLDLQQLSDKKDNQILAARQRTGIVEPPKYALTIEMKPPVDFTFPKADSYLLDNGLKLLWYNNPQTPKINLSIEFKAKSWFDPETKQGLFNFVARMMSEGTKNYSADQFAQALESRGISLFIYPGGIEMSMLRDDIHQGLLLLKEVLTECVFPEHKIEKVRTQLFTQIKQFWDTPALVANQLTMEMIYKNHPYAKNALGSFESVESIARDDLIAFYKDYITPYGTTIAVVGDLGTVDVPELFKKVFGDWVDVQVQEPVFPQLQREAKKELNFPINRDQVVLLFAALSIDRSNIDYDKLVLFDQIFSGGGLNSKLMQLRQQTGLFYGISGSTIAQAGKQPGMVMVRTTVSLDRLKEAEQAIAHLINSVVDTITESELQEAKNAVNQSLIGVFDTNAKIAQAFLFLEKYNLATDYFDHRARELAAISLQDVKSAAKKYLHADTMSVVRVGRV